MTGTADSSGTLRLAHSLLISRFLSPSIPQFIGDARQHNEWTSALGESPESAIERFKKATLLVPFEPSDSERLVLGLSSLYSVAQLKAMLKARRLKLSGTKNELIARLVAADARGLSAEIIAAGLYHCSQTGKDLASRFETCKMQAYATAVAAINKKDYVGAIETYQHLEDNLGFPKWEFESKPTRELIELVMTVRPGILCNCSDEVMHRLRIDMALQCVGSRNAPKHLLEGLETGTRFDAKTASRMIYFAATQIRSCRTWASMGVKLVRHLASGDSCEACQTLNGRTWPLEAAPELPFVKCSHHYGCRCLYLPLLQP